MLKARLDVLMVERGLAETREKAQALIMAGEVLVAGQPATKAGQSVTADSSIAIRQPLPFVSRGGLKLQHALGTFDLDVSDLVVVDVGSSTGGFTDCLLQRGARRVYAVDVGTNQLDWRLRNDARVVVMENTNVRYLEELPERPSAAVVDVSFISLTLVLPPIVALIEPDGWIIALVKPQFEAGRDRVGKGGVVRDPSVHRQVLENLLHWSERSGLRARNGVASPIRGPAGNVEFLVHFSRALPVRPTSEIVEECLASIPL